MGANFYLLPKMPVNTDPIVAREWLDREARHFGETHRDLDLAVETTKRKLANLLLKMKPDFRAFDIRYDEIAQFEKISVDDARRKYRYIEINGQGVQFTFFDHYVAVSVYSKIDTQELEAILAALSTEGGFVLFDPQSDEVIDFAEESCA
jgi:hypothetical protein